MFAGDKTFEGKISYIVMRSMIEMAGSGAGAFDPGKNTASASVNPSVAQEMTTSERAMDAMIKAIRGGKSTQAIAASGILQTQPGGSDRALSYYQEVVADILRTANSRAARDTAFGEEWNKISEKDKVDILRRDVKTLIDTPGLHPNMDKLRNSLKTSYGKMQATDLALVRDPFTQQIIAGQAGGALRETKLEKSMATLLSWDDVKDIVGGTPAPITGGAAGLPPTGVGGVAPARGAQAPSTTPQPIQPSPQALAQALQQPVSEKKEIEFVSDNTNQVAGYSKDGRILLTVPASQVRQYKEKFINAPADSKLRVVLASYNLPQGSPQEMAAKMEQIEADMKKVYEQVRQQNQGTLPDLNKPENAEKLKDFNNNIQQELSASYTAAQGVKNDITADDRSASRILNQYLMPKRAKRGANIMTDQYKEDVKYLAGKFAKVYGDEVTGYKTRYHNLHQNWENAYNALRSAPPGDPDIDNKRTKFQAARNALQIFMSASVTYNRPQLVINSGNPALRSVFIDPLRDDDGSPIGFDDKDPKTGDTLAHYDAPSESELLNKVAMGPGYNINTMGLGGLPDRVRLQNQAYRDAASAMINELLEKQGYVGQIEYNGDRSGALQIRITGMDRITKDANGNIITRDAIPGFEPITLVSRASARTMFVREAMKSIWLDQTIEIDKDNIQSYLERYINMQHIEMPRRSIGREAARRELRKSITHMFAEYLPDWQIRRYINQYEGIFGQYYTNDPRFDTDDYKKEIGKFWKRVLDDMKKSSKAEALRYAELKAAARMSIYKDYIEKYDLNPFAVTALAEDELAAYVFTGGLISPTSSAVTAGSPIPLLRNLPVLGGLFSGPFGLLLTGPVLRNIQRFIVNQFPEFHKVPVFGNESLWRKRFRELFPKALDIGRYYELVRDPFKNRSRQARMTFLDYAKLATHLWAETREGTMAGNNVAFQYNRFNRKVIMQLVFRANKFFNDPEHPENFSNHLSKRGFWADFQSYFYGHVLNLRLGSMAEKNPKVRGDFVSLGIAVVDAIVKAFEMNVLNIALGEGSEGVIGPLWLRDFRQGFANWNVNLNVGIGADERFAGVAGRDALDSSSTAVQVGSYLGRFLHGVRFFTDVIGFSAAHAIITGGLWGLANYAVGFATGGPANQVFPLASPTFWVLGGPMMAYDFAKGALMRYFYSVGDDGSLKFESRFGRFGDDPTHGYAAPNFPFTKIPFPGGYVGLNTLSNIAASFYERPLEYTVTEIRAAASLFAPPPVVIDAYKAISNLRGNPDAGINFEKYLKDNRYSVLQDQNFINELSRYTHYTDPEIARMVNELRAGSVSDGRLDEIARHFGAAQTDIGNALKDTATSGRAIYDDFLRTHDPWPIWGKKPAVGPGEVQPTGDKGFKANQDVLREQFGKDMYRRFPFTRPSEWGKWARARWNEMHLGDAPISHEDWLRYGTTGETFLSDPRIFAQLTPRDSILAQDTDFQQWYKDMRENLAKGANMDPALQLDLREKMMDKVMAADNAKPFLNETFGKVDSGLTSSAPPAHFGDGLGVTRVERVLNGAGRDFLGHSFGTFTKAGVGTLATFYIVNQFLPTPVAFLATAGYYVGWDMVGKKLIGGWLKDIQSPLMQRLNILTKTDDIVKPLFHIASKGIDILWYSQLSSTAGGPEGPFIHGLENMAQGGGRMAQGLWETVTGDPNAFFSDFLPGLVQAGGGAFNVLGISVGVGAIYGAGAWVSSAIFGVADLSFGVLAFNPIGLIAAGTFVIVDWATGGAISTWIINQASDIGSWIWQNGLSTIVSNAASLIAQLPMWGMIVAGVGIGFIAGVLIGGTIIGGIIGAIVGGVGGYIAYNLAQGLGTFGAIAEFLSFIIGFLFLFKRRDISQVIISIFLLMLSMLFLGILTGFPTFFIYGGGSGYGSLAAADCPFSPDTNNPNGPLAYCSNGNQNCLAQKPGCAYSATDNRTDYIYDPQHFYSMAADLPPFYLEKDPITGAQDYPVQAPVAGKVIKATNNNSCFGGEIWLQTASQPDVVIDMIHVVPYVTQGSDVTQNQPLGRLDTFADLGANGTPCWSGPHLHIEAIYYNQQTKNLLVDHPDQDGTYWACPAYNALTVFTAGKNTSCATGTDCETGTNFGCDMAPVNGPVVTKPEKGGSTDATGAPTNSCPLTSGLEGMLHAAGSATCVPPALLAAELEYNSLSVGGAQRFNDTSFYQRMTQYSNGNLNQPSDVLARTGPTGLFNDVLQNISLQNNINACTNSPPPNGYTESDLDGHNLSLQDSLYATGLILNTYSTANTTTPPTFNACLAVGATCSQGSLSPADNEIQSIAQNYVCRGSQTTFPSCGINEANSIVSLYHFFQTQCGL
jgi:hypothetical protein